MFATIISILPQFLEILRVIEHELLLFAAFWFIIGIVDELAIDLAWLWLWFKGRTQDPALPPAFEHSPLGGDIAVLVPAWREDKVIGAMINHALRVWRQRELTLYVGCYANDAATIAAVIASGNGDARLRLVIHDRHGPSTKADCLNRLYAALCFDEQRSGRMFAGVVLHDAEDMVHAAELALIDRALGHAEFVQIPVRPQPQPASPWVAGHYTDEFTEAHAKSLVVRDALGAAIPAAGVGCGFARATLARIAALRDRQGGVGPFAEECLTEDYELGLLVSRVGGRSRFLRVRDAAGSLIATRAYFPSDLDAAVRQKARWIHGIALQGWDRLGWQGRGVDLWMALRDRRGPMIALVLFAAYVLLVIEGILSLADLAGWQRPGGLTPSLELMLTVTFAGFVWRACWRFAFTAREYGLAEGMRSLLRTPVANFISILAGRRALFAYIRVLRGEVVRWDKTLHDDHPALVASGAMR